MEGKIWPILGKIHFIFWICEILGVGTLIITASEQIKQHFGLTTIVIIDLIALVLIIVGIIRERIKPIVLPNSIDKSKPKPSFKTIEIRPDYTDKEEIVYKSKVQIVLQSEQECFIKAAIWRADGGVELQLPGSLKLRPKNIKGEWSQDEFPAIAVPPGGMFSTWIGLRGKLPPEVVRKIHETKGFGTLLLKISGYSDDVEIPI
ncbi:MAG: hypothetical protein ABSB10_03435 [Candidatus Bathyarchaeia archaeon]|jgi:hypothetical protein